MRKDVVGAQKDVVDRYELALGVWNIDVLTIDSGPYDLIISISTSTMWGWDEDSEDADKPLRAVEHLASLLAPGGRLLVTMPVGYNPHVDSALRSGIFTFDELRYRRRVSHSNRWTEIPATDVGKPRDGHPSPSPTCSPSGVGRMLHIRLDDRRSSYLGSVRLCGLVSRWLAGGAARETAAAARLIVVYREDLGRRYESLGPPRPCDVLVAFDGSANADLADRGTLSRGSVAITSA